MLYGYTQRSNAEIYAYFAGWIGLIPSPPLVFRLKSSFHVSCRSLKTLRVI